MEVKLVMGAPIYTFIRLSTDAQAAVVPETGMPITNGSQTLVIDVATNKQSVEIFDEENGIWR